MAVVGLHPDTLLRRKWQAPAAIGALVLFALLFFAPSYHNYFVCDDYEFLGRVDVSHAQQYFSQSWGYGNEYRPLLVYSYAINAGWSGVSPVGYHITNTLLHTLAAALVAQIAFECGLPLLWSSLAALLFLLNPVTAEAVVWIAGRPVVLSTCFVLLSLVAFTKIAEAGRKSRFWLTAVMYLTFLAGLLTYEGAVVLPFLIGLLYAFNPRYRPGAARAHLGVLAVATVGYVVLWNWLFRFHITRFPVETSVAGAAASLLTGITYVFHGSRRLLIAPAYAAMLAVLMLSAKTRKLVAFGAAWYVIALLPFLLVRGFADRFAYLASAAAAILLSAAMFQISRFRPRAGFLAGAVLITFYAVGMQNRIAIWRTAGEIAFTITHDVKAQQPELPSDSTLLLLSVPDNYKHARVFLTGLERAIELDYPRSVGLRVIRHPDPLPTRPLFTFEYRQGKLRELGNP